MWEIPDSILFHQGFFFPTLVLLMSTELMLLYRKMCCNKMGKIPKNISRTRQTKAETVKHVRLFCCLLDHLIANYLNVRRTRADARRAFFFLWRFGVWEGVSNSALKSKNRMCFSFICNFSLFPSLGDVPESWRIAQKLCPGNLGDQQEGTCTVFFCRTYVHNGPECTRHNKNYWVYLELLGVS